MLLPALWQGPFVQRPFDGLRDLFGLRARSVRRTTRVMAPRSFVIFLLGGLVVPLALKFEAAFGPPIWAHLILWPPVIIALAIAFLRPVKATLIAYPL